MNDNIGTVPLEIEYLVPCTDMLAGPPIRLARLSNDDGEYWTAFALEPVNEWIARHPVYHCDPGALWFSDEPEWGWTEHEFVGIFRVLGRSDAGENAWWLEAVA